MPDSTTGRAEQLQLTGYLPGLDVLRGLAVGAVLLFHGFANAGFVGTGWAAQAAVRLAELGKLGVSLFFVLSGFLITAILLKQRERPRYYANFYVRRALRILPAYLLLLLVLKASGLVHWRFVLACLFFVANMAKLFGTNANEYGVVWTLAVEEQFYLLWPTFVRRLRTGRGLIAAILTGCALAPLFRIALTLRGVSTYLLLPTNMDALLYGALLAVLVTSGTIHRSNVRVIAWSLLGLGMMFAPLYVYLSVVPTVHGAWFWAFWDAFGRFDPFCFFLAGVLHSVEAAQGRAGVRRSLPFLLAVFLGYISYGLYLVHPLVFLLYDRVVEGSSLGGFHGRFLLLMVRFAVAAVVSVALATFSRRYYEQLFLGRKRQLAPYAGARGVATETLP